ncbi:piggyBac transposable element-derived protein 5 [Tachysurus vachellii]|uniref:piggyBac transposable element-derived protein 5 n=1 Tax=Tachysurus vachellii TaxID=175792 RepID=UPI00296AC914|nr:piggyBac transposable element-derived protein 5 [Tachysurus vachellii]
MAECGRRALSLLEAARSRYESLQISDDVFGESGDDSSENPFYSTTGDSNSDSCAEASDRASGAGAGGTRAPPPGSASAGHAELKEGEEEDGWNDALQDTDTPHYKDTHGPTQKMPATATAMDFFQLFVPDNVIQNMVTQTNMYAKKFQERFGSDEGWTNVTPAEMKAFLGFVISTSVHRCESVLSIWSSGFFSNRSIALKMSQARFEKILKYFHIVAFRSSQGGNQGLYKIQPFLDSLQQSFGCAFRPSQTQVLHEPLIDEDPVFITTCTERELRKRKKRKFSLWVRQCSSTGFICQIYVHLKEGPGPDGLDTLKNKPQLHSLVARQLCQNLSGRNAIIFTGPSITSLSLYQEFENQDIYCCGLLSTRKSDCTGLPASMLRNPEGPQQRGQSHIKMKGNMSLISWYNKGNFRFLSNAYSPIKRGVIIKRKSGEIQCPLAVEAFAAHLSYICKYDDKYSKYFIFHKPNKTWQQVFWLTISIAINNAYILYKMSDAYHVKRYSRVQFGERLVKELLDLDDCSPTE